MPYRRKKGNKHAAKRTRLKNFVGSKWWRENEMRKRRHRRRKRNKTR